MIAPSAAASPRRDSENRSTCRLGMWKIGCWSSPMGPPRRGLLAGTGHLLGSDLPVELVGREVAERERCLLEGRPLLVGLLGDGGRRVIAEPRREARDEHEGSVQVLADALAIGLDPAG